MVRILFFERYVRILTYLIEGYVKGVKGTVQHLTVAHAINCQLSHCAFVHETLHMVLSRSFY